MSKFKSVLIVVLSILFLAFFCFYLTYGILVSFYDYNFKNDIAYIILMIFAFNRYIFLTLVNSNELFQIFIDNLSLSILTSFSQFLLLQSSLLWLFYNAAKRAKASKTSKTALSSYILSLVIVSISLVIGLAVNAITLKFDLYTIIGFLIFGSSIAAPIVLLRFFRSRMKFGKACVLTFILSPVAVALVVLAVLVVIAIAIISIIAHLLKIDFSPGKLVFGSKKSASTGSTVHNKYEGVKFEGFTEIDNYGIFESTSAFDSHKYSVDHNGNVFDMTDKKTIGKISKSNSYNRKYDLNITRDHLN